MQRTLISPLPGNFIYDSTRESMDKTTRSNNFYTTKELKKILISLGLPSTGDKKKQLVERIKGYNKSPITTYHSTQPIATNTSQGLLPITPMPVYPIQVYI